MHRAAKLWLVLTLALAVPAAAAVSLSSDADASVAYESPYTFDQTFGTALRLVRVDLGFTVLEKDEAAGYVLFEYTSVESGKRVSNGSIEVVKGSGSTHVAVQLPAMPQYHEQMIIDALVRKLVAEHGDPPKRLKPEPDAGEVDGGDSGAP